MCHKPFSGTLCFISGGGRSDWLLRVSGSKPGEEREVSLHPACPDILACKLLCLDPSPNPDVTPGMKFLFCSEEDVKAAAVNLLCHGPRNLAIVIHH